MEKEQKIIIIITVLLLVSFTVIFINKLLKATTKIGDSVWKVEITNEYINIRKNHSQWEAKLGQVKKGETYKVVEVYLEDKAYYWYKIEISKDNFGWIANPKTGTEYLKDINNPNDIKTPTLKFYDEVYETYSIDTISYKHLEITDDKQDYTVSHKVLISKDNKYWIRYTVTDKVGHSITKTQQIVFEVNPVEVEVMK